MTLKLWVATRVLTGAWDFASESSAHVVSGALKMAETLIEACGADPEEEVNFGGCMGCQGFGEEGDFGQ